MSSEEVTDKKKAVRRKNPAQLMKKGDDTFFVINSKIVEEPILACLKWGRPCDPKDEKITLGNVCWFYTPKFGARRILCNSDNKLRIPSDAELIKIYSKTKKKEGDTITLKGFEIEVFDPRWAKLKGKSEPKTKKKKKTETHTTAEKRKLSPEEKKIAKLEKELQGLKKKKKTKA